MPKLENMHFHFHKFSGCGTFQGPKSVFKAVFNKVLCNYCSKFYFGVFWSVFEKVKKNGFPIVFFNVGRNSSKKNLE